MVSLRTQRGGGPRLLHRQENTKEGGGSCLTKYSSQHSLESKYNAPTSIPANIKTCATCILAIDRRMQVSTQSDRFAAQANHRQITMRFIYMFTLMLVVTAGTVYFSRDQ